MTDWTDSLQPASFRGVPFGVSVGVARFGRRLAVHEYPNRDKPWPEDLGRQARRFSVTGFLVTNSLVYGGGDVIAQREDMVAAAETAGSGDLVHPTYGRLKVTLVSLDVVERWNEGRCFELAFTFVEAGDRQFPTAAASTGDAVSSAADGAVAGVGADFGRAIGVALPRLPAAGPLAGAAQAFGARAQSLARDATSLFHVAGQLQGNFGRFAGGGPMAGDVAGLIARGSGLRAQVAVAASSLSAVTLTLGGGTGAAAVTSAAAALAGALRGAASTPRDALRLMSSLTQFGR